MDDRFDFEKELDENSSSPPTRELSSVDRTTPTKYHHREPAPKNKEQKSPSIILSFLQILFKLIILGILILAIFLCYLITLDLPEQQRHLQHTKVLLEKFEVRRQNLWRAVTEPVSLTTDQVILGNELLQKKDAAGAESICKLATESNPQDIHSWICLGEARLALHNAAWVSGGGLVAMMNEDGEYVDDVKNQRNILAMDKLASARETFEIANNLDRGATHAEVRLGLGLSLFLTATRRSTAASSIETSETNPQLLFDAINHLNAAASLTSQPEMDTLSPEMEAMHNAAVYNTALAQLALGDSSAAIPLFRELSASIADNESGINVPQVNMGAALLQSGSEKRASSALHATNKDFCRRKSLDDDEDDMIYSYGSDRIRNKSWKLCSIVQNNIAIAEEMSGGDDVPNAKEVRSSAIVYEKILGVNSVASKNKHKKEASQDMEEREKILSRDPNTRERSIIDDSILPPRAVPISEKTKPSTASSSVEDALIALERAATKDPAQSRLWISLSKAKLRAGDRVGAVEAGTKALDAAKSLSEIEASSGVLDEALTQTNEMEQTSNNKSLEPALSKDRNNDFGRRDVHAGNDDVASLVLQQEVLNLKLQLLQQSLAVSNGFIMSREEPISNMNSVSVENVEKVIKKPSPQDIVAEKVKESIPISKENVGNEAIEDADVDGMKEPENSPTEDGEKDSVRGIDVKEKSESVVDDEMETEEEKDQIIDDSPETVTNDEDVIDASSQELVSDEEMEETAIETIGDELSDQKGEVDGDHVTNSSQEDVDSSQLSNTDESTTDIQVEPSPVMDSGVESASVDDSQPANIDEEVKGETIDKKVEEETTDEDEEKGDEVQEEDSEKELEIILPALYNPVSTEYEEVPATALSYMKMADAYLKKENFRSASKQFLKVLKKSPHHIPAILGYASTFERHANPKQLGEVAKAYSDVTQYALTQNNQGLAQAVLQRALSVSKEMEGDRTDVLQHLVSLAFTNELAADMHAELGIELLKQNSTEAKKTFQMANAYVDAATEDGSGFHPRSLAMLGEIALSEGKAKVAISYLERALTQDLGEYSAKALFQCAAAKESLDDHDGALEYYMKVTSPELKADEVTANAHYKVAMLMKHKGSKSEEIENHIELALNLGHELTAEAVEIMGEHHISVIKSAHRAEWKRYQEALQSEEQRGGIMNGPAISNDSIFSNNSGSANDDLPAGNDALSMLEQGAAAYDGSNPLPTADDGEDGTISISSGQKSRAKATAK